jgi:hypothetical protein
MGFSTSMDDAQEMDVDAYEIKVSAPRPNVSVFTHDTAVPTGGETKMAPAPSTFDLTIGSTTASDLSTLNETSHATITTPAVAQVPLMAESIAPLPKNPTAEASSESFYNAPLQAGSIIGHPPLPSGLGSKRPRSNSGPEEVKEKATVPEQALTGGDDEDEPLPEMDSDMDMSDEDVDEDEDEEAED